MSSAAPCGEFPAVGGPPPRYKPPAMKRLLFLSPLIVVGVLFAYFALGLTRDPQLLPSALIDRPFPAMDLPPIDGRPKGFATADLGGEVALVNIFGSWCVACRIEHPLLMALSEAGEIPIYGIAWKEKQSADTAAWLRQHGDPYRLVGFDGSGRAAIDLGVTGAPETFVVDRAGRIRYKQIGPITADVWELEVKPLVDRLKAEN
jgi:cytochrome c biogenesis protein CcmG, thiol:disulfide interchange protein DsbE